MLRTFLLLSTFSSLLLATTEDDLLALLKKQDCDPKNAHLMEEIAETYKNLGLTDLSLKWIQKKIDLGGTPKELLLSYLALGKAYEEKKDFDKANGFYLKAREVAPKFAEPFYHLAKLARKKEQNELCTYYALEGKKISLPEEESSIISREVSSYLLDEELSIAAFYSPQKEEGLHAINRLLLNKEAPLHIKNQAFSNLRYYIKPIDATYIPLNVTCPKIDEKESYYPINPSIQRTESGYELICRLVNYEKINEENNQSLLTRDPKRYIFISRNLFVTTDKEFLITSEEEIFDHSTYTKFPWEMEGNEDCRLFSYHGENFFSCAVTEANPTHTPQVALGKLKTGQVIPLNSPNPKRAEKNWLPFVHNDRIQMIYSYDPTIILEPDLDTGKCEKVVEHKCPFDGTRFQGSSGPIPFEEGYLVIVHERALAGKFFYYHRFLFLDQEFRITKASPLFYFKTIGVEYCSGMTLDHEEKNVVLTLGVEDKTSFIALIPVESVINNLSIK